jgi:hypothetical protein
MPLPERTYGVEIELVGISRHEALIALETAGFSARVEGTNHRVRQHWKIVLDGSVNGIEVVSPILRGPGGLRAVRAVCRALRRAGATADRSCGLHVHIGADNLGAQAIRKVVERYTEFEPVIDSFMAPSRRGNHNQWCASNAPMVDLWRRPGNVANRDSCSPSQICRQVWGRYWKVNLESYLRQGTVEFRQHGGTCNGTKITNWVRFLLHFVDVCDSVSERTTDPVDVQAHNQAARTVVDLVIEDEIWVGIPRRVREYYARRIEGFASQSETHDTPVND